MRCHGLSCSPCAGIVSCGRVRGYVLRFLRLRVFGMGPSFRALFVPSIPLPVSPGWRDPYSRVMRVCARALGRAFRAGAVCAPDCPGAPPRASRTQGATLPSPPRPFLRRRERMRPPDTACSRPCRGKACRCQRLRRNYYKYFMDNMPFSSLPAAASDSNLRAGAGVIRKSLMPSGERGGCVPPGASSSSPWAPRCNRKRRSDRECRKRKK